MEDGLVLCSRIRLSCSCRVLILVVMEDGLVQRYEDGDVFVNESLNPCCNGRWSRTVCC